MLNVHLIMAVVRKCGDRAIPSQWGEWGPLSQWHITRHQSALWITNHADTWGIQVSLQ